MVKCSFRVMKKLGSYTLHVKYDFSENQPMKQVKKMNSKKSKINLSSEEANLEKLLHCMQKQTNSADFCPQCVPDFKILRLKF